VSKAKQKKKQSAYQRLITRFPACPPDALRLRVDQHTGAGLALVACVEAEAELAAAIGAAWPAGATEAHVPIELIIERVGAALDGLPLRDKAIKAISDVASDDGSIGLVHGAQLVATAGLRNIPEVLKAAERARQAKRQKAAYAAARQALVEATGGSSGPVQVDVLGRLLGSADLVKAASHPDCGAFERAVDLKQAVKALASVRLGTAPDKAASQFLPQQVLIEQTASTVRLPAYVVRYAANEPKADRVPHAVHDRIVAAASDRVWRERMRSEARAERDAAKTRARAEREAARARKAAEETERARAKAAVALAAASLGVAEKEWLSTTDVAKALGISTASVRSAIARGDLPGRQVNGNMGYGQQSFWRVPILAAAEAKQFRPAWLKRAQEAWGHSMAKIRVETQPNLDAVLLAVTGPKLPEPGDMSLVSVIVPERRRSPETVIAHIGPTNSGKTHDALEALAAHGAGVYAAPLRMLAGEAYETLVGRLGLDKVGLVTGEERVNDKAPIVCATAEMAPMAGDMLVLDEVHWASDRDRGAAWTRLMLGGEYRHVRLVGAPDALPLVRSAFPEAEIVIHERLCPLELVPPVRIDNVPERAVVVVFSRKAVFHMAGLLQRAHRRPAVLYGAMPPIARRSEMARFVSGEADVMVATDVIGHGINMPAAAVVFAETAKFDGQTRRDLEPWEVAQIAGRAGRFGFEERGVVTTLAGAPGLSASHNVVESGLIPVVDVGDGLRGFRKVRQGRLAPLLGELGATSALQLPGQLMVWGRAAAPIVERVGWVQLADVVDMVQRLKLLASTGKLARLSIEDAWHLARSPVDPMNEADVIVLGQLARCLVDGASLRPFVSRRPTGSLEALETSARQAAVLRWFALAFPGTGDVSYEEVVDHEKQVSRAIIARLRSAIRSGVAHCESCGDPCAPWSKWCDDCYQARHGQRYYDDWDDDDYDDEWVYSRKKDALSLSTQRRQANDAAIEVAVAKDPILARPTGFPRQIWVEIALPFLTAAAKLGRPELKTSFSELVASEKDYKKIEQMSRELVKELSSGTVATNSNH